MIVRLGFLVAASIAAYAVKQVNTAKAKKPKGNGNTSGYEHREEEPFRDFEVSEENIYVEEEEEKVKRVSNLTDFALRNLSLEHEEEKDEIAAEFEDFFSGEIDFPLVEEKFDRRHNVGKANTESELIRLSSLVAELEEREVKLEGELLEYYGLKEQESDMLELQRQLKIKSVEIDVLNATINSLQAERKKLHEEVMHGLATKKELESARNKIKELQRQIELESSKTKGQLLMLKQHVTGLQQKEEEAYKADVEIEEKLKVMKQLEVEVVELKRMNKELQHEKRELTMKLDAAESRAAALSNMTGSEMAESTRQEINNLRHANEDLTKQVEGLQMNRFGEVEELVYLRWVNACLRYELRNYQTPSGKLSARDLSKNLSPKSQDKAKKLMLEYAGSERGQGDTDMESISSLPSSPGSEDFDNASVDSSSSRFSSLSKKPNIIQKLKRWGKSKDDYSALSSPTLSLGGGSPRRPSMGAKSPVVRGPLEALMLRNAGDGMAITTFGKREEEPNELLDEPNLPRIKTTQVSSDDALMNNVASSFHLMSKSVEGVAEDKYPAYKDRHKLALEREKAIKERAKQARVQKFADGSSITPNFESKGFMERQRPPLVLPPKLTQLKKTNNGATTPGKKEQSSEDAVEAQAVSKMKLAHIEKRAPRVPRPPPTSSSSSGVAAPAGDGKATNGVPPPPPLPGGPPRPPPPPPPGSSLKGAAGDKVHRAPELVEFYQSLMKREAKKETSSVASSPSSNTADVRSNMIGEIANRSTFLLAVKADVETQGDFVNSLAAEVRRASFTKIEDLVSFVNWLDEELSFLVDERAVLKHFDWPEGKADALREAAFEYQDLMKLEAQVTSFVDDQKLPCEPALKKMYSLLEKVEQSVYALLRTRDMAISRYRDFGFPVDWLLDSGVVGKIKLSSVQLARKYMKRVSTELDALGGTDKEPNREFLLLQGVRFAFRVHQFAGGFDAESMRAFEELRSRVSATTTAKPEN